MALPVGTQLRYWSIAAIVFAVILWFLGNTVLPFVLGGAIAYCLDPVADRLERMGCSRLVATALITLGAIVIFCVMALAVLPTLVVQLTNLVEVAPTYIEGFVGALVERFPELLDENSAVRQTLGRVVEAIQSRGGTVVNGLVASALSLINVLVLIFIVPFVTFYLLMDWDNLIAKIDSLVPLDHVDTVRKIASEIDQTLASFIRGQGTVCLILACYYVIALMAVGLQFGLVVGVVAGLISFIPYVGALVGGGLAIGLAVFQWWGSIETSTPTGIEFSTDWFSIALVAGVFGIGQMLEGNFLTPKLVGGSVGLHPVWLIFALSVFGSLFGFVGMLVAVPVSAMIGVVARFMIEQYRKGRLYRGLADLDPDE